ncbi:MAG: ATPase, T2SS/T4P/T4SS family, partial [Deltaproteobacteria bacterium]|nr:ATPase, T2SS/T4P/T4SS family [Deltaproteobacteria bacterium]
MSSENRLGELLVREKMISLAELRKAQELQKQSGENLGKSLAKLGYVSDKEITEFLASQYNVPAVDLEEFEIEEEILGLIPKEVAAKHKIIPISRAGTSLIVAMMDPTNLHAIDDVKFLTGYNVEPVVASEAAIEKAIERYYVTASTTYDEVMEGFEEEDLEFSAEDEDGANVLELEKMSEDAPVIRLVNLMLVNAIKKGASDIHLEPYEKSLRVRYRVDGVLHEEMRPPLKLKNALTSRLKIMSRLDIAERRLPQDGRIKLKLGKG